MRFYFKSRPFHQSQEKLNGLAYFRKSRNEKLSFENLNLEIACDVRDATRRSELNRVEKNVTINYCDEKPM